MKSILIIALVLSVFSCGGAKKAVQSQPEPEPTKAAMATEVSGIDKATQIKTIDKTADNNTTAATVTQLETDDSVEKQNNIVDTKPVFDQELSKSEGALHDIFNQLLQNHVSKDGNVDYNGFKQSYRELLGYIEVLTELHPKLDELSRDQKLAYWINAYNALTIDLILRNYPLNSIKDIKDPWDQRLWKFGDKWLNLNDIEHKILRKMDEPRIHFAIVCASESCPKLLNEAFTGNDLETQLTTATKGFLSDKSKNEISENNIKLSKIFKWFAKDFKTNGTLIDFLNQYATVTISDKAKKSFKDYDWNLNN